MDTLAITELAEYISKETGYDIPPMTPFVGKNFNITRAGIHADGMMKDQEIYNIFDTEGLLGRPAGVALSNVSGLAGVAYWINTHYRLKGDDMVSKKDDVVLEMQKWIEEQYAHGRQTVMSDEELEVLYASVTGEKK